VEASTSLSRGSRGLSALGCGTVQGGGALLPVQSDGLLLPSGGTGDVGAGRNELFVAAAHARLRAVPYGHCGRASWAGSKAELDRSALSANGHGVNLAKGFLIESAVGYVRKLKVGFQGRSQNARSARERPPRLTRTVGHLL
jgi:hypothetical protein